MKNIIIALMSISVFSCTKPVEQENPYTASTQSYNVTLKSYGRYYDVSYGNATDLIYTQKGMGERLFQFDNIKDGITLDLDCDSCVLTISNDIGYSYDTLIERNVIYLHRLF